MKINVFFLSSLSLSITTLFLIIILLKFGKEKVHKILALFNFAVFWWGVGATLTSLNSTNLLLSILSWKITNLGVAFISVFLLHMVYILTKAKKTVFLILAYAQAILFCALILKTNLIHSSSAGLYLNTFLCPSPGKLYYFYYGFWLAIVIYAHSILTTYLLQQKGIEKKRIGYLLFSLTCGFICGAINFLYFLNIPFYQYCNFGIVIYCLATTYAIFRHQLLGIEVIFKKGLLYSLLIGALTGIYLLVIMLTEWLFRGILGYKSLFISLSAAFIIAILFNPLRDKLQAFVDKLFLGKTQDEVSKENELLRQELERSERLKTAGTMALGLAHEIKNPLATIKTFSEFLPDKCLDGAFVNNFSRLVPAEVKRINDIVQNLLDFSKPSPPLFQEVDIN
ncbi:MAG: histidine kinase N-terminal 7TM domain-containing protein, partial [Candidatus Omnitrophota bacterium]